MKILLKLLVFILVYCWSGFATKMILLDVLPNYLPTETHPMHRLYWAYLLWVSMACLLLLLMAGAWMVEIQLPQQCTNMVLYVGLPLALVILVMSLLFLVVWVFTFPCLLFALYLYQWYRQTKPTPTGQVFAVHCHKSQLMPKTLTGRIKRPVNMFRHIKISPWPRTNTRPQLSPSQNLPS